MTTEACVKLYTDMELDHTALHSTLHHIRYCKTGKHDSNARLKSGPITVYTSINLVTFSTVKHLHGNRQLNCVIINLGLTFQIVSLLIRMAM